MTLVIIESPFAGRTGADVEANVAYARRCLRDSLDRGEAPFASHLLYTQVLDDSVPAEREHGIAAGEVFRAMADVTAFYLDRGMSAGMWKALWSCEENGWPHEVRYLEDDVEGVKP